MVFFSKLFSVYVDDLSVALSVTKTGCVISDASVIHVFYADDLCIMSASPAGLQKFIDNVQSLTIIMYSVCIIIMSVCMVFKP